MTSTPDVDRMAEAVERARFENLRQGVWEDLRPAERTTRVTILRDAILHSGVAGEIDALRVQADRTALLLDLIEQRDREAAQSRERHESEAEQARARYESEIEQTRTGYESAIDETRVGYELKIERTRARHESESEQIRSRHESEIARLAHEVSALRAKVGHLSEALAEAETRVSYEPQAIPGLR